MRHDHALRANDCLLLSNFHPHLHVCRSAMIEKKMLLALESLTTKIDSLLGRENDFKFLRNNVGQDWMK
jgi:hypothetical protein